MRNKWSRREFLESSLKSSVAVRGAMTGWARAAAFPDPSKINRAGFPARQRRMLRAAMDEIIPEGDGMPAASQVGAAEYLDRLASHEPGIKEGLEKALVTLESLSRKQFGRDFISVARADRVQALSKLEQQSPQAFSHLRDSIYEAYYTNPKVWKRLGYEFYPTNQAGPHMKPFDESVLAEVRNKPRYYREAG